MSQEPRFKGEVSPERSRIMSRIRGKDTSVEVALRTALWREGIRYRKNCTDLPGRPDIAITKYKIAIFCDSEFFHGKDWYSLKDKLEQGKNADYWVAKIERNMARDRQKDAQLKGLGWTVMHFWSNEIKKDLNGCVQAVKETIFNARI